MLKLIYLIGTFILFFTIHLHFLTLMTCHLSKTLLTLFPLLLRTFMRLSFHWMSRNLLEQTKFLPEFFVVMLRLFVSHFIICFRFHCRHYANLPNCWKVHKLCLHACMSLKLAITILQTIITQFPYYLTHLHEVLKQMIYNKITWLHNYP